MKRAAVLFVLSLIALVPAGAQELKTGYFLDNYVYGYRLNPSATPTDSTRIFVGFLIGDVAFGTASSLGASNFYFPIDGVMYNGLSRKVPAETFLGALPEVGEIDEGINLNVLSVGSKTKRGFLTFEANIKSNLYAAAPKGVAEFLKIGGRGRTYLMDGTGVCSGNYVELAGGYSYRINDKLSVGGTLKALVGFGYADASLDWFSVELNDKGALSNGSGHIVIAFPSISLPVRNSGFYDFSNVGLGKISPCGFGGAVDLGVTWSPVEGLTVGAAVLDIGAIRWKTNVSGVLESDNVSTPVYDNDSDETLLDMVRFKPDESGLVTQWLPATLNLGARYVMPFYDKLSAGLHGSFRFGGHSMTDVRLGVTYTPSHVFSLALSGGATSFGAVFGGAFNLRLSIFNIFAGVDSFVFSITPQMIPVNRFNSTVKAGITIAVK